MIIFFLWAVGNLEVHLDSSFTIIPILRHLSDISGICHFLMTSTPTVLATLTLFSPRLCSVLSPGLLLPGSMSSDLTFLLPPGWSANFVGHVIFCLHCIIYRAKFKLYVSRPGLPRSGPGLISHCSKFFQFPISHRWF